MSTNPTSLSVSLSLTPKSEVYATALAVAAASFDEGSAQAIAGAVSQLAHVTPGGTHVGGSVYLTFGTSSVSGSISLSGGTPDTQPKPTTLKDITEAGESAPSSSEPPATGG